MVLLPRRGSGRGGRRWDALSDRCSRARHDARNPSRPEGATKRRGAVADYSHALRRWLAFDRVRLSLNGDLTSKPCWHMLENEGTVPSDVAPQDFPSVCAVPMTTAYRSLGELEIGSRRANAYSDADVRLLTVVADEIALVLDNALSHEQLRKEQDRLTLLLENHVWMPRVETFAKFMRPIPVGAAIRVRLPAAQAAG